MSRLNENTTNLQDILNKINLLSDSEGIKKMTGSWSQIGKDDNKNISIIGLSFKPSNVVIEARTKVGHYAGIYNVFIIATGDCLDTFGTYNSSGDGDTKVDKASNNITINFNEDGFDLSLLNGVFGQSTYYWTAIGE